MKTSFRILTLIGLVIALPSSLFAQGEPILKAGETFTLRISGVPGNDAAVINGPYTISDAGMIRLHLIDPVSASGLTPSKLSVKIEASYKRAQIYTKPTVNINVSGGGSVERYVTIMGEVSAQGPVAYNPNLTLLAAIGQARGFTDFADRKQVILVRKGTRTYHDLSRAGTKDDVVLKPGDQIAVRNENKLRDLFQGKKGSD
jgi:protein involved in polysaccharide export with SLBB domain